MKILISYFYQIRNFSPNMIPVSTAIGDPAWYKGQRLDKRGIWNGIRCEKLNPSEVSYDDGGCFCCEHDKYETCDFLKNYKSYLDSLDFKELINDFKRLERWAEIRLGKRDIVICLMVHEAYYNPCSERVMLIKWFEEHGYELKEFVPKGGLPKRR